MKSLVSLFIIPVCLLILAAGAFALPSAKIKTLGISPRMVDVDTTDIYTRPSSGLPNVGKGQIVYLAGNQGDTTITGWTWTLSARPRNSTAALSATDQALVTLVPDVIGTFRVTLQVSSDSGQSAPVDVAINSANYVGVGGIVAEEVHVPQCAFCHNGEVNQIVQPWRGTKHAVTFEDAVEGRLSGHFQAMCVRCHTTGYDDEEPANNRGFDDRAREEGWVFIDSANSGMREGVWDSMKVNYPQTAAMANVQCENCHGPGSAHMGNLADNKMAKSLEVGVCARCHDSGPFFTKPYEWSFSKHSKTTRYPTGPGRGSCVGCHSGNGFVDRMNGLPDSLRRTEYLPVTCATCHNPHDATNEKQLRNIAPQVLVSGVEVDFGLGNMCVNCHRARRSYEVDGQRYSRSYGSHNNRQTEMLAGTNAYTYGQEIPSGTHARIIENVCVGCHMKPGPTDVNAPGYAQIGGHSFAMKSADGVDNVAACTECHGEIETFEDIMADGDWDGDGTTEGAMTEIDGMVEALAMRLPPVGEPRVVITNAYTQAQLRAAWNYRFVVQDGSSGAHNADYARGILAASLADDLGVEQIEGPVPFEYSLGSPYPNPFNPVTSFSYTVASNSPVSLKVFDMAGREVATVLSGEQKAGIYKAAVSLAGRPSGVYLLRMAAGDFAATRKLVLVK